MLDILSLIFNVNNCSMEQYVFRGMIDNRISLAG